MNATLYTITFLLCWTLLGRLIFGVYLRSPYLLHRTMENFLALVCGPWLWLALLSFKKKRNKLR